MIVIPNGHHVDLVAAVFLASHVPRDSGPPGPQRDLVSVVATCTTPGTDDSGLHLRLPWIW